jgi:hypothetical protein
MNPFNIQTIDVPNPDNFYANENENPKDFITKYVMHINARRENIETS